MLAEQLRMVNERGLDMASVIRKAAELNALNGSGILASKLELVLDVCSRDLGSRMVIERPEPVRQEQHGAVKVISPAGATELAEKMKLPLSKLDWDTNKNLYERMFGISIPCSDEITGHFGTWEGFWSAAGFDMELYSPKEIIEMTLQVQKQGFFTRKHFDGKFPDLPSSSYVLQAFGGSWKNYADAVSRARGKARRPLDRIRELLSSGVSVRQTRDVIVAEFADRPEVDLIYRKRTNDLYKRISRVQKQLKDDLNRQRLSRDEIAEDYSTLESIANKNIRMFRLYAGRHKVEKRVEIADDVCACLVQSAGDAPRFAYLGLEGPNFGSYIVLQEFLSSGTGTPTIDPARSLVAESNKHAAASMQSIVDNHDVIEGGVIFEGLKVENAYLSYALDYHREKRFDIINLDYMGGWSRTKAEDIQKLFGYGQIADSALLYVTLLNSDIEKYRVRNGCTNDALDREGFGTDDQKMLLNTTLERLCDRHGYRINVVRDEEYFDTQKMLFIGFHLEKIKE
ncbi:hypothetical protein KY363_02680 [Candidatus Woesearchaeota archaeon]|nr:hypothetical protein [Candidatus Woesearchaeota archaeon]